MPQPLLTGEALRKFVFEEQTSITPLAENLIYRKSITIRSGDAGVGKSIFFANLIRDLSLGIPVFNAFHCPKPVFCYYIPFERGDYEIAQRLRGLSKTLEPAWSNVIIKPDFIGYDVYDGKQAKHLTETVTQDLVEVNKSGLQVVVFLDPIISMVSGEIKEEKFAKAITRCANIIQTRTGCALELSNHTTKEASRRLGKGKQLTFDPFYGSQALKAFCTSGAYLNHNKEKDGVDMYSTKSSHGNVVDHIYLAYDPFTYSLYSTRSDSGVRNYDKILAAVRAIHATGQREFAFSSVAKHPLCHGVSITSVKETLLGEEPFKSGILPITGIGKPTLLRFSPKWT